MVETAPGSNALGSPLVCFSIAKNETSVRPCFCCCCFVVVTLSQQYGLKRRGIKPGPHCTSLALEIAPCAHSPRLCHRTDSRLERQASTDVLPQLALFRRKMLVPANGRDNTAYPSARELWRSSFRSPPVLRGRASK